MEGSGADTVGSITLVNTSVDINSASSDVILVPVIASEVSVVHVASLSASAMSVTYRYIENNSAATALPGSKGSVITLSYG